MSQIWIATFNKDKYRELKELLREVPVEVHAALELPHYSAPPENGFTFADNARLKAKSLKALRPEDWVLADDSGLEVEALKGLPGIHSARYAGPKARDIENTSKLLKQITLQSSGDNRKARFQCFCVLINPAGEEKVFQGTLEGEISRDMRGRAGFGYDPVFVPAGEKQTLAELGLAFKNRVSHRALAMRHVRDYLKGELSKSNC